MNLLSTLGSKKFSPRKIGSMQQLKQLSPGPPSSAKKVNFDDFPLALISGRSDGSDRRLI